MISADCSTTWQSLTAAIHRGVLNARGFAGLRPTGFHRPDFGKLIWTVWCGTQSRAKLSL